MTKPILIIKTPSSMSPMDYHKISDSLKKKHHNGLRKQYHILVVGGVSDSFEFQGIYPKDFDLKSFDELKQSLSIELIESIN